MSQPFDAAPPDAQRASLQRYRVYATSLLLLAAAIFLATKLVEEPGFYVGLVRAGAEAAMVGGLADWFAVTALFRRPLGLPIPHTAVIPSNKDRIGEGFGTFVQHNFLQPELVRERLRRLKLAARMGNWLADRDNAETVAGQLIGAVPYVLDSVQDQEIRAFVQRALNRRLSDIDLAPAVAGGLGILREGGYHDELFDSLVVTARRFLRKNQHLIYDAVEDRSSWWLPRTVDRGVAKAIVDGLGELLDDMAKSDSEARGHFDRLVDDLIADLQTSSPTRERLNAVTQSVMQSAEVQGYLGSLWQELRQAIAEDLSSPTSVLRQGLADGLRAFGAALAQDEAMQERLDARLEETVTALVAPWRGEIGRFFADVVRGWEAGTVSERIELAVGRDLQYIRMNGTLVGALVGCAIFLFSRFVF